MSKSKKISGAALIDKSVPAKNVKNLGNLQQKNQARDLSKLKEAEVAATSDHRDNQIFSHANSNRGK